MIKTIACLSLLLLSACQGLGGPDSTMKTGESVRVFPCEVHRERLNNGLTVLMIPMPRPGILRRVEGVLAAQGVPFIEDVAISRREGYELVPLPEGASYLGFIFARAPTPQQAEQALREAHGKLAIVVAPLLKLMDRR